MSSSSPSVRALWRSRPRSRFVRASLVLFAGLITFSWFASNADLGSLFSSANAGRLGAYWETEIKPPALRGRAWDWDGFRAWAGERLAADGAEAVLATLAVSVLAIVLAALLAALLSVPAARTLATPEPFLSLGRAPGKVQRLAWAALRGFTHALLVIMRSLPEYVLAFLLMAGLRGRAWPAVLALAIHNAGILGRLNAEVIENLPASTLRPLSAAGAGRLQIAAVGVLPAALPRFLLYFFYRWETCVREATVLGMLGLVGLGYLMKEANAHDQEDRFVFYVLLASAIVLAGDFLSAFARGIVRRAS